MKGLAFRKLGRSTGHRDALLRNLVTSLIQHERINTTVAKAKEAQREAEKIITKAKREFVEKRIGRQGNQAMRYVYQPAESMPLLQKLAERYADRPGGYTRIHLHGNRPGDNAPRALLELVDQPKGDLKLQMTAMAMGRQMYLRANNDGAGDAIQSVASALGSTPIEHDEQFHLLTRRNAEKLVKFGGEEKRALLMNKAKEHFYRLMAMRQLEGDRRIDVERTKSLKNNKPRGNSSAFTPPMQGQRRLAGMEKNVLQSGPDEPAQPFKRGDYRKNSVIRISKGVFAKRQTRNGFIPKLDRPASQPESTA
ncbi:ribosomal protein L17 [Meira miltonrushii]|uniref:Ribosomal protein L17 n=1 Tax=Meira miltonrushii TaxID=1280837 RepID=A0A316VB57_9BASI|nr:ribosomal protein L17 [Meira miltonrushii]PWN34736.1 ribosomal protein L17 [Meira miltonrushii]